MVVQNGCPSNYFRRCGDALDGKSIEYQTAAGGHCDFGLGVGGQSFAALGGHCDFGLGVGGQNSALSGGHCDFGFGVGGHNRVTAGGHCDFGFGVGGQSRAAEATLEPRVTIKK